MWQDIKKGFEQDYQFWENVIFLLLRIILFVCLLVFLFKNTDKWWELGFILGTIVVIVMFRRLDFFEVVNLIKAGTKYPFHNEASTASSYTPEEIRRELKKGTKEKIIKSEFPRRLGTQGMKDHKDETESK